MFLHAIDLGLHARFSIFGGDIRRDIENIMCAKNVTAFVQFSISYLISPPKIENWRVSLHAKDIFIYCGSTNEEKIQF
jgi:hypothetical protein